VYFSNTEKDALHYGFIDKLILAELRLEPSKRKIQNIRLKNGRALKVLEKAKGLRLAKRVK
jgi:hypothetical protein